MSAICCAAASVPSAAGIAPSIAASNHACTEEAVTPTGGESGGIGAWVVGAKPALPT
jgi:hypothetical protein